MFFNRQRLYLFGNWPYVFLIKIGISKNVISRKKNVSKTGRGRAFLIFSLSVPYARKVERLLHFLCSPFNIRWTGSGHTEWFFALALLVALPVVLLAAVLEIVVLGLLFYLSYHALFT